MQAKEDPIASGEDVTVDKSPTPSIIRESANQPDVQKSANASVGDDSQPVELPADTATKQASQDATMSGPQTETHQAEEITPLRSATPIPPAGTEQHVSSAIASTSTNHSEPNTANPCTATITDPLELPVQPHQDGDFGLNEETTPGDQDSGPADATAQAHLIMATVVPHPAQLPGVITQIAPAMQPDTDSSDEAYAESTTTSFITSIKSEVSRGVLENERLYPSYGQHAYGMPIDEDELDRMDLQHRKYEMVIGDKHFLAPIGPTPQRILDLGTGTGIWALDVADMYPSAQVIGVDIAPIQPKWTASNCQFEIDDVEETWTFKENSFDFIHFRDPLYVVRNWPRLMEQCYSHTKPGGWCELACIYPVPMCDDGTMPADSGFKVICDKFIEASYLFGAPADSPLRFAGYLRDAGFIDVAEHIFKVPSSPWPKNRRLKQIGALEMTNVVAGATAFGLRAFEKVFGWTKDQTELAMVNFRRDVKNRHYHQYCQ
jgi:SAM-dependent methyltransferase